MQPSIALCLLMLWPLSASAADTFAVRSPSVTQRADARILAQLVRASGLQPRMQRHYEHGEGWRWSVGVAGFDDLHAARRAAERLTGLTGRSYAVYGATPPGVRSASSRLHDVDRTQPAAPEGAAFPSARAPSTGSASGSALTPQVLRLHAARIHGLAGARDQLVDAEELTFRFVRHLADGRRIVHHYQRGPRTIVLEFHPEGAPRRATRFQIDGGRASVHAPGREPIVVATASALETVARLSPSRVLDAALTLSDGLRQPELWRFSAEPAERAEWVSFRAVRPTPGHFTAVELDPLTSRVRRAVRQTDRGDLVYEIQGDLGGDLALPIQIISRRDGVIVDRIELLELSVISKDKSALPASLGSGAG